MLKYFALLIVAAAVCQAKFSQTQEYELNLRVAQCDKRLNLPLKNNFQRRAQSGDVDSSDPVYKKFVACFMRELGITHENGTIKRQTLIDFLAEGHDRKLLQEVVQECDIGIVEGDSADDTAFNYHVCFWTKKRFEM